MANNTSLTNNTKQSAETMLQYHANSSGVRRFRTPGVHDVLSGRGGSANAHPGNCQFRDIVAKHKMDYNLAGSNKDSKAEICHLVIDEVRQRGGRFLTKESSNGGSAFWVELPEDRVMAKTSQALREGAPKIRRENALMSQSRKRVVPSSSLQQPEKRVRVDYKGHTVLPNEETPPMTSLPDDNQNVTDFALPEPKLPVSNISVPRKAVPRSNSLAHSEISVNPSYLEEFHNPFEDESDIIGGGISSSAPPVPPPSPGVFRESSISSVATDMAGLGALLRDDSTSGKLVRSSSILSRYDDAASVGTTGLPVWDLLEGAWDAPPSLVSPQ